MLALFQSHNLFTLSEVLALREREREPERPAVVLSPAFCLIYLSFSRMLCGTMSFVSFSHSQIRWKRVGGVWWGVNCELGGVVRRFGGGALPANCSIFGWKPQSWVYFYSIYWTCKKSCKNLRRTFSYFGARHIFHVILTPNYFILKHTHKHTLREHTYN